MIILNFELISSTVYNSLLYCGLKTVYFQIYVASMEFSNLEAWRNISYRCYLLPLDHSLLHTQKPQGNTTQPFSVTP